MVEQIGRELRRLSTCSRIVLQELPTGLPRRPPRPPSARGSRRGSIRSSCPPLAMTRFFRGRACREPHRACAPRPVTRSPQLVVARVDHRLVEDGRPRLARPRARAAGSASRAAMRSQITRRRRAKEQPGSGLIRSRRSDRASKGSRSGRRASPTEQDHDPLVSRAGTATSAKRAAARVHRATLEHAATGRSSPTTGSRAKSRSGCIRVARTNGWFWRIE